MVDRENDLGRRPSVSKEVTDRIWYDPRTGVIGYGTAYGEHSFNGQPLGALTGEAARKAFLKRHRPSPNEKV